MIRFARPRQCQCARLRVDARQTCSRIAAKTISLWTKILSSHGISASLSRGKHVCRHPALAAGLFIYARATIAAPSSLLDSPRHPLRASNRIVLHHLHHVLPRIRTDIAPEHMGVLSVDDLQNHRLRVGAMWRRSSCNRRHDSIATFFTPETGRCFDESSSWWEC